MKGIKKDNTRTILGLTQLEIATILNVTRSQWSHYEGNTRDLPNGAGLMVGEMILYMLSPEAKALKSLSKPEYQENKTKLIMEKRLKENEYQLMKIHRKITKEQQKLEKYSKAVQLTDFLNSPEGINKAANLKGLKALTAAIISNYKECKSQLLLFQVDQELLQNEKLILEVALQRLKAIKAGKF